MTSKTKSLSAFDQGQRAGAGAEDVDNPFAIGSREHNNFEVGRRFGASRSRPYGEFSAIAPVRRPEQTA